LRANTEQVQVAGREIGTKGQKLASPTQRLTVALN